MNKDHLLKLLCSVYTQEISADEAFDELEDLIDHIKRLEDVGDALYKTVSCGCEIVDPCKWCRDAEDKWREVKENATKLS